MFVNSALKTHTLCRLKKKIKRSEAQCVSYSWEAEAKDFGVQGQPMLYSKAFCPKKKGGVGTP